MILRSKSHRAEAKAAGKTRYNTGLSCVRGHYAERMTSTGVCIDCREFFAARWKAGNAEKVEAARLRYRSRPDVAAKEKARLARQSRERRSEINARRTERYRADPAAWLAKQAEREKRSGWDRAAWARSYLAEHQADYRAIVAKRRAAKLKATPPWLTQAQFDEMKAIYAEAKKRGNDWHVDHVVPLQGETVCGLHVPWNLEIIPALENRKKANKIAA